MAEVLAEDDRLGGDGKGGLDGVPFGESLAGCSIDDYVRRRSYL